jgi:FeS assembly ATPase SufC
MTALLRISMANLHVAWPAFSSRTQCKLPCVREPAVRHRQSRCIQAWAAILEVRDLRAKIVSTGSEVLKGVNFSVEEGQTAAIMGKNGCGKSTFSKVLVGHPDYEVTSGTVFYKGENLLELEPEERARAGLFLSFQAPVEVPGVNNVDFLRMAANARRKAQGKDEFEPLEFYLHLQPKVCPSQLLCTTTQSFISL